MADISIRCCEEVQMNERYDASVHHRLDIVSWRESRQGKSSPEETLLSPYVLQVSECTIVLLSDAGFVLIGIGSFGDVSRGGLW